jgi:hypothetical protein
MLSQHLLEMRVFGLNSRNRVERRGRPLTITRVVVDGWVSGFSMPGKGRGQYTVSFCMAGVGCAQKVDFSIAGLGRGQYTVRFGLHS